MVTKADREKYVILTIKQAAALASYGLEVENTLSQFSGIADTTVKCPPTAERAIRKIFDAKARLENEHPEKRRKK